VQAGNRLDSRRRSTRARHDLPFARTVFESARAGRDSARAARFPTVLAGVLGEFAAAAGRAPDLGHSFSPAADQPRGRSTPAAVARGRLDAATAAEHAL